MLTPASKHGHPTGCNTHNVRVLQPHGLGYRSVLVALCDVQGKSSLRTPPSQNTLGHLGAGPTVGGAMQHLHPVLTGQLSPDVGDEGAAGGAQPAPHKPIAPRLGRSHRRQAVSQDRAQHAGEVRAQMLQGSSSPARLNRSAVSGSLGHQRGDILPQQVRRRISQYAEVRMLCGWEEALQVSRCVGGHSRKRGTIVAPAGATTAGVLRALGEAAA
mmetsp:Transcript_8306/g.24652  ORF Transcript_8306/g.24652 Transcript_8306/m.24652 type:complete len:215 (-) Transcript_8306:515-1159(-)